MSSLLPKKIIKKTDSTLKRKGGRPTLASSLKTSVSSRRSTKKSSRPEYDHKKVEVKWPSSAPSSLKLRRTSKATAGKQKKYNHKQIEVKWQREWNKSGIYKTKDYSKKPKCYVLDMFPYPSGLGLHVGHPKGYIATDIYSRMKSMQGFNVLHPMGWDAFGLPAENYAIKNKVHPKISTAKNIKNYKRQLDLLGFSYDWSREIDTTDPEYYRWTQWIFLQMFKQGLAYESYEPINWCPSCQTGLANEDLEDGRCERCGSEIEQKPMRQWVLKITDYAERLLNDLVELNWPESIKDSQRHWIGGSNGALIKFAVTGHKDKVVEVFTTRPETIFGATYIALSPELIKKWLVAGWTPADSIVKYVTSVVKDRAKQSYKDNPDKTGINSGLVAINPATAKNIPVWITNYVLGSVGTGAIMAVPAHDQRDFEFAKKYNLPIEEVVIPNRIDKFNPPRADKKKVERLNVQAIVVDPKTKKVLFLKSNKFGWTTLPMGGVEAGEDIVEAAKREVLEETGLTNLKFIKVLGGQVRAEYFASHKDENRVSFTRAVMFELEGSFKEEDSKVEDDHELIWLDKKDITYPQVVHAELEDWLERWDKTNSIYVGPGVLINSGSWSGSNSKEAVNKIIKAVDGKVIKTYKLRDWVFSRQRYWGEPIPIIHCEQCGAVPVPERELPVKLPAVKSYAPTGTGESPLADIASWVKTKCPQCQGPGKRETNTMPQWAGSSWYYLRYMDPGNNKKLVDPKKEKYWAPVDLYVGGTEHATRHLIYARFWHKFLFDIGVVSPKEPFKRFGKNLGLVLGEDGRKMSKRWGNVINPDDVVKLYGADTLRLYTMFMGPFEAEIAWNTKNMIGSRRFLEKVWRLASKLENSKSDKYEVEINQVIKKVGEDIESFSFNTAVSTLMILVNKLDEGAVVTLGDYQTLLKLIAPFTPHLAEELWQSCGFSPSSIHLAPWPQFNSAKLVASTVSIAVQVNGKTRTTLSLPPNSTEEAVLQAAKEDNNVATHLQSKPISRVIFIPNRLINMVT